MRYLYFTLHGGTWLCEGVARSLQDAYRALDHMCHTGYRGRIDVINHRKETVMTLYRED